MGNFYKILDMQLDKIFMNLGLAKSATELATLLLVLLVVSTIFWLLIGRFRLHNFLINVYISYAITLVLPKEATTLLGNFQVIFFIAVIAGLTFLNKYLFDIHQSGSGLAIWQVFIMSALEVLLVLSIVIALLPVKEVLRYISKDALIYFTMPWWKLAWMILPLAFLVFIKKRER
jgi:hypothetical protein